LTHAEVANDPLLADPNEMAAWKYFHFTSPLASWKDVGDLAIRMREAYYNAASDRDKVAQDYLRACTWAVKSAEVRQALDVYDLAVPFRVSVAHPDTGEEYYLP
jgi:hypothetical protein